MNRSDLIDRLAEKFVNVFVFMKKIMRLQHEVIPKDVSKSHMDILVCLMEEGKSSMSQLSKATYISNPNLTPLIDKLVEMQYVERVPDANDRRVVTIGLTKSGRVFMEQSKAALEKNLKEVMGKFSPDQLRALEDILETMKKFNEME